MDKRLIQFAEQVKTWHESARFQMGDRVIATWQGEEIEGIVIGCCLAGAGTKNDWDFLVTNEQEAVWYSQLALKKG
ncbi:MAG: hypothetical protein ACRC8A_15075 [Microcoleaceae cyanobacterium]